MKLKTLFICVISILFQNVAFALTPEEVACNQAVETGDAAKALAKSESLLKANKTNTSAWICQGRAYTLMSKTAEAVNAYKQAETSAQDDYDRAIATLFAGNTYKRAQQNAEAINRYEQSIVYAEAAKNNTLIMNNQIHIGDIHFANKAFDQSLDIYLKANKLAANDNERGETLEKIARNYHVLNQQDLALEYQIKAYLMMEKAGTLDQYASSSITLGRYYILNKNYDSAEHILNKITKFAKDQGGAYFEAQGSYVLAQLKAAKNDMPAAKALVEYAKGIAKSTHDKALEDEINQETKSIL